MLQKLGDILLSVVTLMVQPYAKLWYSLIEVSSRRMFILDLGLLIICTYAICSITSLVLQTNTVL